uniref:Cytochrome P450 n=1 Tax=Kalanchoe fedtschenkoi TaxID=63787 RepID=A0A7N0ZSB9_KALFE
MRLKLGTIPTIVISSPHLAKQILQTHDHLFSSRYLSDTVCILNHHNVSVGFLPVCPKWRNLRKALATELFNQAKLDSGQTIRLKKLQQMVDHVGENTGKVVEVGLLAFITMINFLSNTLMSVDLTDYGSGSSREFHELVSSALELVAKPNLSNFFPVLRFLDLQGLRKANRYKLARILDIIGSFVDRREKCGAGYEDGSDGDVLSALLRKQSEYELSSEDIRHLFADLFVAGADTSSVTVEWALTELLRSPSKMAKAQSEIAAVLGKGKLVQESDIPKLPYLHAVVKETLRLHPAAPFLVPHKALADVEIDGFTVPAGSQILINVWSMGRDSRTWPDDPLLFKPERFLESGVEYKGGDFELIPFGAGRRICPGLPLAHRMVHVVLGCLIHLFEWEVENGMRVEEIDMDERFGLSVHKLVPLRVIPLPKALAG